MPSAGDLVTTPLVTAAAEVSFIFILSRHASHFPCFHHKVEPRRSGAVADPGVSKSGAVKGANPMSKYVSEPT